MWRLRAIADDGTLGLWSPVWNFSVATPTTRVASPELLAPPNRAVRVGGGPVTFAWTRKKEVLPNVTRFDRLEIHNGSILSVSFDVYHLASEVGQPTVSVNIPLYPNFGPDFWWRVVPFEELTDSKPELFHFSGIPSEEIRTFRLLRDPAEDPVTHSGLGAWNADRGGDGRFGMPELGPLGRSWRSGRDTSTFYDPNHDFDRDGFVEPWELLEIFETQAGNRRLLHNGLPAPLQITPLVPADGTPELLATSNGADAKWWAGYDTKRFLVEWIDHTNYFRGHYVDRLDTPTVVFPSSNAVVVLSSAKDPVEFLWEGIPDSQEYDVLIDNTAVGPPGVAEVFERAVPKTPFDPTVSLTLTAAQLVQKTRPTSQDEAYTLQVYPKACGHFADPIEPTPFRIQFQFPVDQPLASVQTENKQSGKRYNLPLLLGGWGRLYARQPGLHHWRVTAMGENVTTGIPSPWQSFGVVHLGPGYAGTSLGPPEP